MEPRDFSLDRAAWNGWFDATGRAELNLLLFALWDPIGVNDIAITAGEYENYVSDVLKYVRDDDPEGLTAYLLDVEKDAMGLSSATATVSIARGILAGAYGSAWIWSGRPLPGDLM
jgi:hypothetical protein